MVDSLPIMQDYKAIVESDLASFVTTSRKIGGELPTMVDHVTKLFATQQQFLRQALQMKKPTNDQQIMTLIKPQSTIIETICGKSLRKKKESMILTISF